MPEQDPEVTETAYVPTTDGPARDTEAFYKGTPAPGERVLEYGEARDAPGKSATPDRIPRDRMGRSIAPVETEKKRSMLPAVALAAGLFCLLGIGALAAAMWARSSPAPIAPVSVEPEQEKQWEGLKVKKGLR